MKIVFAAWAESCLRDIYDYYSKEAGPEKASEIVNKIIDRAETLLGVEWKKLTKRRIFLRFHIMKPATERICNPA